MPRKTRAQSKQSDDVEADATVTVSTRRSKRVAEASAATTTVSDTPAKTPAKPATKKRTAKQSAASNKISRRSSDAPQSATGTQLGLVDRASGLDGHILNDGDVVYDVMCTKVDLVAKRDEFHILQVVEDADGCRVWQRWGRTGTAGTNSCDFFDDAASAVEAFESAFKDVTGCEWSGRDGYTPVDGKFEWLRVNHAEMAQHAAQQPATWQYYVDDGVDGKADGWYDYTEDGSAMVEQLWHEFRYNGNLHQRVVESGMWEYLVDLQNMTQTNVKHAGRKCRHIRRKLAGMEDSDDAPTTAAAATSLAPSTPTPQSRATTAPATVSPKPAGSKSKGRKVDAACSYANSGSVVEPYAVMLNQTNIGANNNKYYVIQMVLTNGWYYVFTRWGRVGEPGQTQTQGPWNNEDDAATVFEKKFKDKTSNNWGDRENFKHKQGKYDLVELDDEDDDDHVVAPAPSPQAASKGATAVPASKLDARTQELVAYLTNEDMFKEAMARMDIDVKKMPLGKLSKAQIQRGLDVLVDLQNALNSNNRKDLEQLSSKFYQIIPHNFGRQRPPVIATMEMVQEKMDLCNVLTDIESTQGLMQTPAPAAAVNPIDEKYDKLRAKLELLDSSSEEYKMIAQYASTTMTQKMELLDVWQVERDGEHKRFAAHNGLDNRMLLWHGTNIAVVAAILKGGLRIMPHSGGRVGKGIYMASEHGKSAWYVRAGQLQRSMLGANAKSQVGVMFLVEGALGKEHHIFQDDWQLTQPPQGYDSIVARGRESWDRKKATSVTLDGKKVTVPWGKTVPMPDCKTSSFHNDEYLVYKESQQRLRFVCTFKI